jgi:hypothetical protein
MTDLEFCGAVMSHGRCRVRGLGVDAGDHVCGRDPNHEGDHVCGSCHKEWVNIQAMSSENFALGRMDI